MKLQESGLSAKEDLELEGSDSVLPSERGGILRSVCLLQGAKQGPVPL